jgi:hypothetical protein
LAADEPEPGVGGAEAVRDVVILIGTPVPSRHARMKKLLTDATLVGEAMAKVNDCVKARHVALAQVIQPHH